MYDRGTIVVYGNREGMVVESTCVNNQCKYRVVFDADTTEWLDEQDLRKLTK